MTPLIIIKTCYLVACHIYVIIYGSHFETVHAETCVPFGLFILMHVDIPFYKTAQSILRNHPFKEYANFSIYI